MEMKLLGIENREIVAIVEFSVKELEDLELALSLCNIDFDGKEEKEVSATNYLTKSFFPAIKDLVKNIKGV